MFWPLWSQDISEHGGALLTLTLRACGPEQAGSFGFESVLRDFCPSCVQYMFPSMQLLGALREVFPMRVRTVPGLREKRPQASTTDDRRDTGYRGLSLCEPSSDPPPGNWVGCGVCSGKTKQAEAESRARGLSPCVGARLALSMAVDAGALTSPR